MYLQIFFLILCSSLAICKQDDESKECIKLEKLFKEVCKANDDKKTQILKKAVKCYAQMIPRDADQSLKDYFEKKCGQNENYCDELVRKRCGPDSFEQMDDKQKEGALNFYKKYQNEFPKFCENGLKCLNS